MKLNNSQKQIQSQTLNLYLSQRINLDILSRGGDEMVEYLKREADENPLVDSDYFYSELGKLTEKKSGAGSGDYRPMDFSSESEESYTDYLLSQIRVSKTDSLTRNIAEYIILNLDEKGYFSRDSADKRVLSHPQVEEALMTVKSLEPYGTGAESLSECILIQIDKSEEFSGDLILKEIVRNHLEDLGRGNHDTIKKIIGDRTVSDIYNIIRSFEPIPSSGFGGRNTVQYIVYDAEVLISDSGTEVIMNDDVFPDIRIGSEYMSLLKTGGPEARIHLKPYFDRIRFIKDAVSKRKITMKKVIEAISLSQKDYLMGKSRFPVPLLMKETARKTSFSVSTVSRAVKHKWIKINKKSISLSSLYAGRTLPYKDEIRENILKLITEEDKSRPLSDQEIMVILNKLEFDIKRRTVHKYRQQMNIPSSVDRRL